MDTKRWLWFVLSTALLQFLIDIYVLRAWQKFVRSMGWSAWLYRPLWVISFFFVIVSPFISFQRSNQSRIEDWMFTLFIVATLWYVPKLPIAIVLFFKDIVRFFGWIVKIIKSPFKPKPISEVSPNQIDDDTDSQIPNSIPAEKQSISNTSKEQTQPILEGRRRLLQAGAWTLASAPFIIVARGIETADDISVRREELLMPKITKAFDGFKIVQISDIHAGSYRDDRFMQEVRRRIIDERPSIIVLTGDFVNFQANELKIIRQQLEMLKAEFGVWASLGNHDHYSRPDDHALLKSMIKNSGINLLVNENHTFEVDGDKLQLIGTDNTGVGPRGIGQNFADITTALVGTSPDYATILMAHDPTYWDLEINGRKPIDLMLSGHTHGGQVGMNIFGKEMSFAQLIYKQWAGLYQSNHQYLYVNRGIGTVGPPIRIGIPPEITVFTLRSPTPLLG